MNGVFQDHALQKEGECSKKVGKVFSLLTAASYLLGFVVMLVYADGVERHSNGTQTYMMTGFPVLCHCIGVGAIVLLKTT